MQVQHLLGTYHVFACMTGSLCSILQTMHPLRVVVVRVLYEIKFDRIWLLMKNYMFNIQYLIMYLIGSKYFVSKVFCEKLKFLNHNSNRFMIGRAPAVLGLRIKYRRP